MSNTKDYTKEQLRLLTLYREMLAMGGMVADEEGLVGVKISETETIPLSIREQQMCLPTHIVNEPNFAGRVAIFHPFVEQAGSAPSPALEKWLANVVTFTNARISQMVTHLLALASSPNDLLKVTPNHADLLIAMKECDETSKMLKAWQSLMKAMGVKYGPQNAITWQYVKKNSRQADGTHAFRTSFWSYPLLSQLKNENLAEVCGVKLSKAARKTFIELLGYLLSNPETGVSASMENGVPNPSVVAFLRGYELVMSQIESIAEEPWYIEFCAASGMYEALERTNDLKFSELNHFHELAPGIRSLPPKITNASMTEAVQAAQPGKVVTATPTAPQRAYLGAPPSDAPTLPQQHHVSPTPVAPQAAQPSALAAQNTVVGLDGRPVVRSNTIMPLTVQAPMPSQAQAPGSLFAAATAGGIRPIGMGQRETKDGWTRAVEGEFLGLFILPGSAASLQPISMSEAMQLAQGGKRIYLTPGTVEVQLGALDTGSVWWKPYTQAETMERNTRMLIQSPQIGYMPNPGYPVHQVPGVPGMPPMHLGGPQYAQPGVYPLPGAYPGAPICSQAPYGTIGVPGTMMRPSLGVPGPTVGTPMFR